MHVPKLIFAGNMNFLSSIGLILVIPGIFGPICEGKPFFPATSDEEEETMDPEMDSGILLSLTSIVK